MNSNSSLKQESGPMVNKSISKVAVLCSGGDSPGMNGAIRAVVRTSIGNGLEIYGIQKGLSGLLEGNLFPMSLSSVGNIIQRGGTILQSSRCPEFYQESVRKQAYQILTSHNIDALIIIGGNGSFNAGYHLSNEHNLPVVGIPATIDNDVAGTHYAIGFDTALHTAVEAIDKIRDTASSHARNFLVEVMGRSSPHLALTVGVCTGAENIVLDSGHVQYDEIANDINRGLKRGKNSSIVIVAEGNTPGLSYTIQEHLKEYHQISSHVCVLGHIQRGGIPSPYDRFIGSQMGHLAVMALINGKYPTATSLSQGKLGLSDLKNCLRKRDDINYHYLKLAKTLSI